MHDIILQTSIHQLMCKQNLDQNSCQAALHAMLAENANPLQSAAFLVLLRAKSETADEILGFIQALREKMIPVPSTHRVLDIVGTGGDKQNTINISTGAAILAASCGVKIAKHGNRAVSSLTGSADVLEAMGVNIMLDAKTIAACIDNIGIGFCYSPVFNPAFLQLKQLRHTLNVPTTLNILGPLLNPTCPEYMVLGTFDATLMSLLAQTIIKIGVKRAVIVHGCGLDEISCLGPNRLIDVTPEGIKEKILDPTAFGLSRCQIDDLRGGDPVYNAQLLLDCLSGAKSQRCRTIAETLILNAAVALNVYGIQDSMQDAVDQAYNNLYNGSALHLLQTWIEFSQNRCLS